MVRVNTNANSQNATWRGTASLLRWAAVAMSEVYETQKLGLLKRPWVALQGWTCEPAAGKDAECEHGEGDQRLGGMEASGLPYLRDSAGADPVRLLALESPAENWGLRRPGCSA